MVYLLRTMKRKQEGVHRVSKYRPGNGVSFHFAPPQTYDVLTDLSVENQLLVLDEFKRCAIQLARVWRHVSLGSCDDLTRHNRVLAGIALRGMNAAYENRCGRLDSAIAALIADFLFPSKAEYLLRTHKSWSGQVTVIAAGWCQKLSDRCHSTYRICSCRSCMTITSDLANPCQRHLDSRRACSVFVVVMDRRPEFRYEHKLFSLVVTEPNGRLVEVRVWQLQGSHPAATEIIWRFGGIHTRAGYPLASYVRI